MALIASSPANSTKPPSRHWPVRNAIGKEEKEAVMELFDESIRTGVTFGYSGEREKAYTSAFAEYLGGGYADAVNSGSNALYVALRALDLDPFQEVIVSPITDPGGVMAVPLNNLIPIPADTTTLSYNVGAEQIEARITPQTRAVIVAHIGGISANMTEITAMARKNNLLLIEDCSQSHGALHRGRHVGTFGDIGIFSMMNSKHHCMGGQGGMVFTKDKDLHLAICRASDRGKPFGIPNAEGNVIAALNCNTDELACAIGLAQLKKLPHVLDRRRQSAQWIAEGCREHLKAIRMTEPPQGDTASYWFLLFRLHGEKLRVSKKEFVARLESSGIPFLHEYNAQPFKMPWHTTRHVFGKSGYPWNAPGYKGDRAAAHPTPNLDRTIETHFMLYFNESVGERECEWVLETLEAAEQEFLI